MKSEKSGKLRGRPRNKHESIQVSWRIPHEIYSLLIDEQVRIKKLTGVKVGLSKVLQVCVEYKLK